MPDGRTDSRPAVVFSVCFTLALFGEQPSRSPHSLMRENFSAWLRRAGGRFRSSSAARQKRTSLGMSATGALRTFQGERSGPPSCQTGTEGAASLICETASAGGLIDEMAPAVPLYDEGASTGRAPSSRNNVRLDTFICSAMSSTVNSGLLHSARARSSVLPSSFFLRPPRRPRSRAARKPACVRSRISASSNSANAPMMWNMSRPTGVPVSMPASSTRSAAPFPWIASPSSIRCFIDRARRSSLTTTSVSPSRRAFNTATNPGRSEFAPVALSV